MIQFCILLFFINEFKLSVIEINIRNSVWKSKIYENRFYFKIMLTLCRTFCQSQQKLCFTLPRHVVKNSDTNSSKQMQLMAQFDKRLKRCFSLFTLRICITILRAKWQHEAFKSSLACKDSSYYSEFRTTFVAV